MARPRKHFANSDKRYTCACGSELKYTSLSTHMHSKKHSDYVGSRYPFSVERNVVFHFSTEGERHWEVSKEQGALQEIPMLAAKPVLEQNPTPLV